MILEIVKPVYEVKVLDKNNTIIDFDLELIDYNISTLNDNDIKVDLIIWGNVDNKFNIGPTLILTNGIKNYLFNISYIFTYPPTLVKFLICLEIYWPTTWSFNENFIAEKTNILNEIFNFMPENYIEELKI